MTFSKTSDCGGGPWGGKRWGAMSGQKFARAFAQAAFEGAKAKRRARMFQRGELRLVLLHLIAKEPSHGYDLIRQIEELTGGRYAPSPGIVYPTLTLMAEMEQISEATDDEGKRIYTITEEGQAQIDKNEQRIADILARLEGVAEADQASSTASIRRAMGNLKAAVRIRLADEAKDSDIILDVTDIIDEAARQIGRLGSGSKSDKK